MKSVSLAKVKGHTHKIKNQLCITLLPHAEVISGGEVGVPIGLNLKVEQLWCYFKMQVIKH